MLIGFLTKIRWHSEEFKVRKFEIEEEEQEMQVFVGCAVTKAVKFSNSMRDDENGHTINPTLACVHIDHRLEFDHSTQIQISKATTG